MGWKPEYEINRKLREAENPALRTKRLESAKTSQEKNREARKEYMKAYYAANPEKFTKRSPEKQALHNATRRAKYATDPKHREMMKAQAVAWTRENPEKRKDQRLRLAHGISRVDFLEMLALQHNRCAICGFSSEKHGKLFPVVDHCHKTGQIRGLLCMNCNQALGKFQDSIDLLMSAAMYLQRNS